MNYIGIDYGLKSIGLSIATGPLAEPLATISKDQIFNILPTLCSTHNVKDLVIGFPDGNIRPLVEKFYQQLEGLGYICHLADETLSSRDALASLSHKKARKRKILEHAVAATIILQNWLDSHSGTL
ncbi:hypothetical protein A2397_02580 [Candidatus Amesbacteria bacterium RIFOXYB1_FULL_44_23]|uniref:Putative pre-16S rRNA nuclease n=1 Tax=Candidatus Amesbacteria bacterium RIFOXYB1_FULL_44_23 TaxID=1797263 RepID=A0A1F4ZV45_9BACT|nr:MAG: hypothetical protein A2397_02580 [Candidatus Amesbacteria bacterium RIFOXYB1_FULL_44_23]